MDLSFATTTELIEELTRRTTFIGVVIHSDKEHRNQNTVHSNFQISTAMSKEDLADLVYKTANLLSTGEFS